MSAELLLLTVGVACLVLGAFGQWWVWARPALTDLERIITARNLELSDVEQERDDALHDRDEARRQRAAAEARAEGAETALGHQLLTDAMPSLDAARAIRGRS